MYVILTLVQCAMCQCLTIEELFSLFICFGKAVQDKALVSAWVGHELIFHHLYQQLVIQKT